MQLGRVLLTFTTLFVLAQATGFSYSKGWSPGQQTAKPAEPTPTLEPKAGQTQATQKPAGKFSWSSLLTDGPLGSFLSRSGINVTERLEDAKKKSELPWDERIPLITDENYEAIIFNETFATPEEETDRVWFLIV